MYTSRRDLIALAKYAFDVSLLMLTTSRDRGQSGELVANTSKICWFRPFGYLFIYKRPTACICGAGQIFLIVCLGSWDLGLILGSGPALGFIV